MAPNCLAWQFRRIPFCDDPMAIHFVGCGDCLDVSSVGSVGQGVSHLSLSKREELAMGHVVTRASA